MKHLKYLLASVVLAATTVLSGCGTVGGAVQGAGEDLSRAGEWIRNR